MSTIFKGIVKLNPQMVANFVHSTIEAVINNLNAASFSGTTFFLVGLTVQMLKLRFIYCRQWVMAYQVLTQFVQSNNAGTTSTNLEAFFAQETSILAMSSI